MSASILLYNEEIYDIESLKSEEDQIQREQQYIALFAGNKGRLFQRFVHLHYDGAFSSILKVLGRENELHKVSKSREKHYGYDTEETVRAFYIARHCAPLCGKRMDLSYQEVYSGLQNFWRRKYSEAIQKINESLNEESELTGKGRLEMYLDFMRRTAKKIDGFNISEFDKFERDIHDEAQRKYGKE